jgi:phage terminase small subunit
MVLIMAQEFSTYEQAVRELKKKGAYITLKGKNNDEAPSPWVTIRNQAQKNYRDIAALFGLDPLSSQKIGPTNPGEEDPFEKIQKKYNDQH